MSRRYPVVVVPVDFSERSATALEAAAELLEDGGTLHVVHALVPLSAVEPGVVWQTITEESRRARVSEALEALVDKAGVCNAKLAVRSGGGISPAAAVLAYAEEVDGSVIVLSSHGRTGLARFALGSVAERLVRHAHCDVLVVRKRSVVQ